MPSIAGVRWRSNPIFAATPSPICRKRRVRPPEISHSSGGLPPARSEIALEAIDRFDPSRGEASFATFAGYRIRGSILNGLEKATEASAQSAHRRRFRLRERTQSLGQLSGEDPHRHRALDFAGMVDMAILLAMGYVLEDSGQWNPAGADKSNDPYRSVQLERLRTRLKRLVDVLPERERAIVCYHYYEHMEFQDIGAMLGISKGRVSQLHARALQLIREGNESLDEFELDL